MLRINLKGVPKITKAKYIEVMPGAVGMWQANLTISEWVEILTQQPWKEVFIP
jgi:hypothetical protein